MSKKRNKNKGVNNKEAKTGEENNMKSCKVNEKSSFVSKVYEFLKDILDVIDGNSASEDQVENYNKYNSFKNSLIFLLVEYNIPMFMFSKLEPETLGKDIIFYSFLSIFLFVSFNIYRHIKNIKNKGSKILNIIFIALHLMVFVLVYRAVFFPS